MSVRKPVVPLQRGGTYLRSRLTGKVFRTKYPLSYYFGPSNQFSDGTFVFEKVTKTDVKKNPARRSRKATRKKTRRKVTRARRNPKGIAKSLKYKRGSHRQRYAEAEQMERLAKRINDKKLLSATRELKSRLIITRQRRNPAPIQYAAHRIGRFCIIEGLVRDDPHARKFSFCYYTGNGFSNDRKEAFRYLNEFAAEGGMRKIVNSLPPKVLQIRVIPS